MEIQVHLDIDDIAQELKDSGELDYYIGNIADEKAEEALENLDAGDLVSEALRYSSFTDFFDIDEVADELPAAELPDNLAKLDHYLAKLQQEAGDAGYQRGRDAVTRELEEVARLKAEQERRDAEQERDANDPTEQATA